MDERAVKRQLSIKIKAFRGIIPLIVLSFVIFDSSFGLSLVPRLVTRFCYNSPNPTQVNSQCVLCNYYLFDATLLGCTGSSALNVNITAAQAFCVISNCLGQVKQSPIFLGRKKRSDQYAEQLNDEEIHKEEDSHVISQNKIRDKETDDQKNDQKSTQTILKYNPNEDFIVAKEVEALIIDLPESIDDAVFSL